jgi:uncharacterized radical SAM superfamily Fe-S cluster-containing enzyme
MSEACFAATRALCNTCGQLTDAKIVFRDGRVLLVKWCPEHGRSEALVCSDQDWYLRSLPYIKPQTLPEDFSVQTRGACPGASCGLCPGHQQHTCVPILEITDRCDLSCPICLVGCDAPGGVNEAAPKEMTPDQVDLALEELLRCEPRVNMLTLSGGEPTAHPDFVEILKRVARPEIGLLSVSTNGLRLSRDDDMIKRLRDAGAVISLQLDGFSPATYEALRGRADLADVKRRVIDRVLELGGSLSLTVTLARGINEAELDPILKLLFSSDQVLSMMVQPLARTARSGERFPPHDPLEILTIPDVVRLLAAHSDGVLEQSDFTPLPCSHPSCFALTYLLCGDDVRMPLPRVVEAESYLDIIKNQALLNTDADTLLTIKDSLYELWTSNGLIPNQDAVLKTVKQVLLDLNALGGDPEPREVLRLGTRHIKSIFIHHFMDRYTFDLSRAVKCCNHYPQADGRLLPVCVRNNVDPALLARDLAGEGAR